ncbi:DUF6412 domain-containing protein [Nocardiaceae bacterium NPDC056970]
MAPIRSALAERLNTVQLTWFGVLTLVIATTSVDGPAAIAGTAVAIALIFAVTGHGALSQLHRVAAPAVGPPHEERHLRGAFRRQSAPNTPGRPRRPRAPGQVPAAA